MNEISKKRREWVKTAAIIFLSVMLVLTFFSNTIMNYSLPEVAAQYVQSGTITAKIRGTGDVESSDQYNVTVKQTRKVMSVAVKEGDQVQQGDVLLYLADEESLELETALEALETAQKAYDEALLAAEVTSAVVKDSQKNTSNKTYRQQIEAAQAEVTKAEQVVKEKKDKVSELATAIMNVTANGADTEDDESYADLKEAKEDTEYALTAAQNEQTRINSLLEYEKSKYEGTDVSGSDLLEIPKIKELTKKKQKADLAVINAQTAADDAALAFEKASNNTTSAVESLTTQKDLVQAELDAAELLLSDKQKALEDLTGDINKALNLEGLYKDIADAQEKVDEETEKSVGAVVTADIAGTVIQMNAVAGQEISAAEEVAVIQPEGKGYTMSFNVTNEQAKRLSVGDKAELVNAWYYDEMDITLTSIKPNPENPSKEKVLTFDVAGDVMAGQSLNVSVGQKSANYDMLVPNSAIREDNNGKFILTVESKSSPLGNRYIATRVDVEVLASDDTQSAISGALYGYEFVITTSTKPVEAGQQVRLAEN